MKILCTICARGGSEGVKNKNIISLQKKPLIAHTLLQAKQSQLYDYLGVSSDSAKILSVAKKWGADFLIERPSVLATSTAAKLPAIQHAVIEIEKRLQMQFDIIVDLDATSPLRSVEDLQASLKLFLSDDDADNLITACRSRRSPYFNMVEKTQGDYVQLAKIPEKPFVRRQDVPESYDMNASIYIWKRQALFSNQKIISDRTLLYVMPEERSIDIDTPLDLAYVKLLAKHRKELL